MASALFLISLLILCSWRIPPAHSILPISCTSGNSSCTLENYQGIWYERSPCSVAKVVYPTTEAELVAAVASGVKNNQKMKLVSKLSHSLPRFACPGGSAGLLISTSMYESRISIDASKMTVTADAGVQLEDLLSKLAAQGLALPCTPYFNGLSISGVISTGSHGSSLLGKGSAVHEYVSGIRIVVPASQSEGYAKVIAVSKGNADLDAVRMSIGVLGAISQVTLDVEPMFKRSITKQAKDDSNLENDVLTFGSQTSFGDINWYPFDKKVLLRIDNKVSASTPGQGRQSGNDPSLASNIRQARIQEENVMAQMNSTLVCARSANGVQSRVSSGDGLVSDSSNTFKGYPVVGFNHLMETQGGCQDTALNNTVTPNGDKLTCAWDKDVPGQFYYQGSISIPLSRAKDAILDMKKIRDANPKKLCVLQLYGGVQLRYVKGSTAYLDSSADSVVIDMLYYRERKANTPRLDEDATEEIEQMLLKKYSGRPHWGKNKDFAFENIGSRVVSLPKFVGVMQRYDPNGYFSSEWTDAILGIKRSGSASSRNVTIVRDFCALEGLCVCSQDRHCAPDKGFLCKPGAVFTDTRVCRKT